MNLCEKAVYFAVRARVTTTTEAAPAFFSTLAHSLTVLPVVITSSSNRIRFSNMPPSLLTANAPLTLILRSSAESSICGSVCLVLEIPSVSIGRDSRDENSSPRRTAWLKPLLLRRDLCKGTGIITSGVRSDMNSVKPSRASRASGRRRCVL